MILQRKELSTVAGAHTVYSSAIKMVSPLKVKLDGTGYDIIYSPSVPVGRQVAYKSNGLLTFDATVFLTGQEKVYVFFKL